MSSEDVDAMVRGAIGGDADAIAWVLDQAKSVDDAVLLALAALLEGRPDRLERAGAVATTSRDRQVVVIARAHLHGDHDLVDAFARDHLVDYPDSLIVAWVAAGAAGRRPGPGA